ncbi:hypothetical protein ABEB36_014509 [Hypothenemus hampei]|uniref:Transposable element P transposase-like RNase H domain-containing protein n=1 Tax=Hypothenemus hampei TaxID=57062 RepID=A0ABD1E2Y6_HYPHA
MVFLLRGIKKRWKQPLGYVFTEHTCQSNHLAFLIKKMIEEVQKRNFTVIGTICDQGKSNVGALNILRQLSKNKLDPEKDKYTFLVNGQKIVALFDPPHLLKTCAITS